MVVFEEIFFTFYQLLKIYKSFSDPVCNAMKWPNLPRLYVMGPARLLQVGLEPGSPACETAALTRRLKAVAASVSR